MRRDKRSCLLTASVESHSSGTSNVEVLQGPLFNSSLGHGISGCEENLGQLSTSDSQTRFSVLTAVVTLWVRRGRIASLAWYLHGSHVSKHGR